MVHADRGADSGIVDDLTGTLGKNPQQPNGKTVRYREKLLRGQPGAPACNP